MSSSSSRAMLRRALVPFAIVSLLLCAGISETQAEASRIAAATPTVVVFVDPQEPALDARQRQILAEYRWVRTADPATKLHVVNLTGTPWDDASRRRILAESRLTPDQAVFLQIPEFGPIPPHWPDHKPALAAADLH